MQIIKVKDFSRFPGPRYIKLGKYSGEEFRDNVLIPAILEHNLVKVDLDGTVGYGSSFLDEAFAGLLRKGISQDIVWGIINHLKSDEDEILIEEIKGYVEDEIEKD
ncbi:STAS-like domain-containing protein [Pseudoalteromonas sp. YIC-656]|uniref:STAS-like domain-containing protein n=1 Tax=Pseudoalteromonas pernae TaxID=3118054 RepID=UPI00324211E9